MGRRERATGLDRDHVLVVGPTITMVRVDDPDEGLYYTALLGSVPLCPHRPTFAQVLLVVRRVAKEYRIRRQLVSYVLRDGPRHTSGRVGSAPRI